MDLNELKELDPKDFEGKTLLQEEILEWFKICDAIWLHDGDPEKPHAKLSSGKCSNAYINCNKVLQYTNLCEILARQMILRLKANNADLADWVISSSYAAITFGHEVARQLGCCFGFTEKDPTDPKKKRMLWGRFEIPKNAIILQIEELITTLDTTKEVRRAILKDNPYSVNFSPIAGTLVHRPSKLPISYSNYEVIPSIELEIWALPSEKCHLCKAGSKPLRPKTNWKELTGKR
ncbi:hypothetical protein AMJ49_03795 [Parcubacteria bacterium DG_74_2]|nr:MAG: hypothetical protein AMJ49_03795 [Parcubacteria bacterium DG_74_2]